MYYDGETKYRPLCHMCCRFLKSIPCHKCLKIISGCVIYNTFYVIYREVMMERIGIIKNAIWKLRMLKKNKKRKVYLVF